LAEDYILKQITASLIYPESQLGKEFWQKVYAQAQAKYGTTNVPINTFNKVWIVPEKAVVYENGGVAFVLENHLKVMLEQDYLSLEKHSRIESKKVGIKETNLLGSQIIREIVIPILTKEVNEGKNFIQLRQVFYSLILATWYKKKIRDSILNKIYSDQNKIGGVNVSSQDKDKIYQAYLKAFKKGVYSYIKEESDPITDRAIPRKYFSGGVDALREEQAIFAVGAANISRAQIAALARLSIMELDVEFTLINKTHSPLKVQTHTDRAMSSQVLNLDQYYPTADERHERHLFSLAMKYYSTTKDPRIISLLARKYANNVRKLLDWRSVDEVVLVPSSSPGLMLFAKAIEAPMRLEVHFNIHPMAIQKEESQVQQKQVAGQEARAANISGKMFLDGAYLESLKHKRVVLLDDLYSTGTTIKEAVRVLNAAHPAEVIVVVIGKAIDKTAHPTRPGVRTFPKMLMGEGNSVLLGNDEWTSEREILLADIVTYFIQREWSSLLSDEEMELMQILDQDKVISTEQMRSAEQLILHLCLVPMASHSSDKRLAAALMVAKMKMAQFVPRLFDNFLSPIGVEQAGKEYGEATEEKNFEGFESRRNARNASLYALYLLFLEGKSDFKPWINKIEQQASLWLQYYGLDENDPKIIDGMDWEKELVINERLGHDAEEIPSQIALLENLRLYFLADKMNLSREITTPGYEKWVEWVYPSINDIFDKDGLARLVKKILYLKLDRIQRRFGSTGLSFFPLGIGTVWFAEKWPENNEAYVEPSFEEIDHFLLKAFREINQRGSKVFIDTARVYGRGESEERLGEFFRAHENEKLREKSFIATKWGLNTDYKSADYSPDNLFASVNASLKCLGRIDLLFLHTSSTLRNMDDLLSPQALKPALAAMQRMKRENYGGIKYLGISISSKEGLEKALRDGLIDQFDVVQTYGNIFLENPGLMEKIRERGKVIVLNSLMRKTREQSNPEEVYRNILSRPGFSILLTGTRNNLDSTLRYADHGFSDGAMVSNKQLGMMPGYVQREGGINLNPTQMNMQVEKVGADFKYDFNGIKIDAAQIAGATFTIHQMTPVTNLLQILGLNIKLSENIILPASPF